MKFNVLIEQDDDGYYVANVPQLPGCHTQARSLDELMKRIREAIEVYLDVQGPVERSSAGTFIGVQVVEV